MSLIIDMPAVFQFAQDLMDTLYSFEAARITVNLIAVIVAGAVLLSYFMFVSARD